TSTVRWASPPRSRAGTCGPSGERARAAKGPVEAGAGQAGTIGATPYGATDGALAAPDRPDRPPVPRIRPVRDQLPPGRALVRPDVRAGLRTRLVAGPLAHPPGAPARGGRGRVRRPAV